MANDILLDDDNDLKIVGGDFVINESEMQDVGIILQMNPGELKSDPILGVGMIRRVKSGVTKEDLEVDVKLHLKRDGKDYNTIKRKIKYNLNSI